MSRFLLGDKLKEFFESSKEFVLMFSSVSESELSQEEEILKSDSISKEDKQELIKALKNRDTIANKLCENYVKNAEKIKKLNNNYEKPNLTINQDLLKTKKIENKGSYRPNNISSLKDNTKNIKPIDSREIMK